HVFLLCSLATPRRALHSFPTRRSSDLGGFGIVFFQTVQKAAGVWPGPVVKGEGDLRPWRYFSGVGVFPSAFIEEVNISSVCQPRSEEHTSELQSRFDIVCRLLLEQKKR